MSSFKCSKCLKIRESDEFYQIKNQDNLICRSCISSEKWEKREKECRLCHRTKDISEFDRYASYFSRNRWRLGPFKTNCRICDTPRQVVNKQNEILQKENKKLCIICKQIKSYTEFRKSTGNYCSKCHDQLHKNDKTKWRRENRKKGMLGRLKFQAKKKNITFDITEKDIEIPQFCPILGIELKFNDDKAFSSDFSPSVDKLIPEKGYVKGNVHVISNRANRLKNNGTAEEHEKIAQWMRDNGCN